MPKPEQNSQNRDDRPRGAQRPHTEPHPRANAPRAPEAVRGEGRLDTAHGTRGRVRASTSLLSMFYRKPRTALVLGSGGARGWAHLGVLQALRELRFRPDIVVGTSAGSIAAAAYVTDSVDRLAETARTMDWRQAARLFLEFGFPRTGLIKGTRVMALLHDIIPTRRIEELPIPYASVATDYYTQKEVVLSSGDLHDSIRASISIPTLFAPFRRDGLWLLDGGLVNPLPVSVARALGADRVVAVDVNLAERLPPEALECNPEIREPSVADVVSRTLRQAKNLTRKQPRELEFDGKGPSLIDVALRTLRITENAIQRERMRTDRIDILVQPVVGHINDLEFQRAAEAIAAGYEATMALRDRIRGEASE